MSNYICKYGLYHDKPVIEKEPSSNNGWIYTAYAKAIGLPISYIKMAQTFKDCVANNRIINRLPGKKIPPLSRDEVIGMYYLGMLSYSYLKSNHFVYHGYGKPVNLKTIKEILSGLTTLAIITMIKGKHHRNNFWKYDIKAMYQLAYRLNPADVYWLKKCEGIKPHTEECLAWKLYVKVTVDCGSESERNILWLQAKKLGKNNVLKKINVESNFKSYFGSDHILTRSL